MTQQIRIAVLSPIPTPYRDGFWNVLASRDDVELFVYYCSAGKQDRPWRVDWEREYPYEVLPGANLLRWRGTNASLYNNPGVGSRLSSMSPDAVLVGGYNHPTMAMAIRECIGSGVPYFLMNESHLDKRRTRTRKFLKAPVVRWVVGHMAGGFPTGSLAEQYLLHYGADNRTLSRLPNVPDICGIRDKTRELRVQRTILRAELGLSAKFTILFVGRLIPTKGADRVIKAVARLQGRLDADVVVVGDGPERGSLERLAVETGLGNRVHFPGFVEPTDTLKWYAAADLFVLPSVETWGVVALEALASGLPVVLADSVGCWPDVLNDPRVGEVVPNGNTTALAEAIARQSDRKSKPDNILEAWQPVFSRSTYAQLAEETVAHLKRLTASPERIRATVR